MLQGTWKKIISIGFKITEAFLLLWISHMVQKWALMLLNLALLYLPHNSMKGFIKTEYYTTNNVTTMNVEIPKDKNCSFMTVGNRDRRERQREKVIY